MTAVVGLAVLVLWAADAGTKDVSTQFVVNAGACPEPEVGLFAPSSDGVAGRRAVEFLLPEEGVTTVLQIVVIPFYQSTHALRLERPHGPPTTPAQPRLRLVQTKLNFWTATGHVAAGDERGVAGVRKKMVVTRFQPVDEELAALLEDVWGALLARTQHVNEILVARGPDGGRTRLSRNDGTYYHLWHNRRSGSMSDAPKGSAFSDLLAVKDLLFKAVEAAPEQQAVLLGQVKSDLVRLRARLAKNESCLMLRDPGSYAP